MIRIVLLEVGVLDLKVLYQDIITKLGVRAHVLEDCSILWGFQILAPEIFIQPEEVRLLEQLSLEVHYLQTL